MRLIPETAKRLDWPRLVAEAVNGLLRRTETLERVYQPGSEPANPVEGQTYYDAAAHKMRTFDGTVWRDHW